MFGGKLSSRLCVKEEALQGKVDKCDTVLSFGDSGMSRWAQLHYQQSFWDSALVAVMNGAEVEQLHQFRVYHF
jgi:hypothetical protein